MILKGIQSVAVWMHSASLYIHNPSVNFSFFGTGCREINQSRCGWDSRLQPWSARPSSLPLPSFLSLSWLTCNPHREGGKQIDGAIPSLYALDKICQSPTILAAQKSGKLTVLFDSGIRTGSDIIKALALGAQGVLRACILLHILCVHVS